MKLFLAALGLAALQTTSPVAAGSFPDAVAALLDTTTDPCDDFYQYACGSWLASAEIAPDKTSVDYTFDLAQDAVDAAETSGLANDSTSLVGALFTSCMDMDARNALGAEPLQTGLASILQVTDKLELFRVAGRLARTGADFITNLEPNPSLENATHNVLYVSNAELTLDAEYYQNLQVLGGLEDDLVTYAATILNLTGFELSTDEYVNYGEVVLGVEKQLIELQDYYQWDPVSSDVYYLLTYDQVAQSYPFVFGAFAEGMQLLDDAPALTKDTEIALLSLEYFDKAEELVALLELDVLKTYVAFNYVNSFAKYLSQEFVTARFEFFSMAKLGAEAPLPLETVCRAQLEDLLPVHMGALYVEQRTDMEELEAAFVTLAQELQDTMYSNIETLEWLDDESRVGALAKLDTLEIMYSQPDASELDKEAEGLAKLDPTAFYSNVDLIQTARFVALTWAIDGEVDRDSWIMSASTVNAYYYPKTNQVVIPAAFMQSPYLDLDAVIAQIFGSIGVIVAHEITHGFDNNGANFDADGNWNAWWSNDTLTEFTTRTQCLIDQYNAFYIEAEDGEELVPEDGQKTVSENIADNGGLHVAFTAYKSRVAASASGESESDADDQLFFVSYAQTWCGKMLDETAMNSYLTNVHATSEARVNGAAMNSAAFATAFSCSADAPMNPSDKCVLY